MVSYIFAIAVVNLGLGFLLAAYLGRRYRAMEAAAMESLPPLVEAPLAQSQERPAPAAVSPPPASPAPSREAVAV